MVSVQLQGPEWFFGMDASLTAFAAIIAFCVAFVSLRVYRITGERKYAFFTASFVLLTLGFVIRAATDALLEGLFVTIPGAMTGTIFFFGYVTHILLTLTAYLILVVVTHKIKDWRIIALLFLILVPSLLISGSYFLSFYGLSAIFLAFIALAYYQNCRKVCKIASYLVFIAFLLLMFAQLQFLLEALHDYWYVGAHLTQAVGYLVLLFALIKTLLKPRNS